MLDSDPESRKLIRRRAKLRVSGSLQAYNSSLWLHSFMYSIFPQVFCTSTSATTRLAAQHQAPTCLSMEAESMQNGKMLHLGDEA